MKVKCCLQAFDEKIIPLMQEENRLSSQYSKLIVSAEIEFKGKIYNLSQMQPFMLNKEQDERKKATQAYLSFFEKNEDELDRIYDQLVQVRTQMAQKLGYDNYIPLGYLRMNRLDYTSDMVAMFRKQVQEEIVPIASKLYQRQAKRLGLETLTCFDEKFEFASGNPVPKCSFDKMISIANIMYHELSSETGSFFDTMVKMNLLDLVSKPKKRAGGYCTSLPEYKVPFIFSNFNGTSADVDVLTHEAGHAFQIYMSKDIELQECLMATEESCEIHSMSMEFFAWPWMPLFFKEDTEKYYYLHLSDSIKFIPYGVLVDHFQHEVYAYPEMSAAERKSTWHHLEKMYLPHKNYEDAPLLERGGWWYRQNHIFNNPFYYIDYTLAQLCALQFWERKHHDDPTCWHDYVELCKQGGKYPFLDLVQLAGLKSPFKKGTVHTVMMNIEAYLHSIDDTQL